MRNVVLHGAQDLRVEAFQPAELAPERVRVRFAAGGICGSDLHYYRHGRTGNFVLREPLTPGHEVAGIVESDPSGRLTGRRVAVNPSVPCGRCAACREGRDNICEAPFFMGSASRDPHMQGGFRSVIDVLPQQCFPVPDEIPLEAAALAEPVAVCLHAVDLTDNIAGKSLLVIGAGPIGLLVIAVARLRGAGSITASDLSQAALARAEAVGADSVHSASSGTLPGDFDIVVEASGSPAGLSAALHQVRRGGQVVQLGNLPGGDIPAPVSLVMSKELRLLGSFRFTVAEYGEAVELIASRQIDPLAIVTGTYPLEEAVAAFEASLDRERSSKVMLVSR